MQQNGINPTSKTSANGSLVRGEGGMADPSLLLNFEVPLNVAFLDELIAGFFSGRISQEVRVRLRRNTYACSNLFVVCFLFKRTGVMCILFATVVTSPVLNPLITVTERCGYAG